MSNLANYEVLATDLLSQSDKEQILTQLGNIKTPNSPLPSNFSFKWLDHNGRCVVVTYRGVEIMLLFKRMTSRLSTLNLEVAPRSYLKDPNEAWLAYKLMDVYPGASMHEKLLEMENDLRLKDSMIQMLELSLAENDKLLDTYVSKKRKKEAKTAAPAPVLKPMASDAINEYLLKVKPVKLQDHLRAVYLWGQGFDLQYQHNRPPYPDVPVKYQKKIGRHLTKLNKLFKKDKLERQLTPYQERPPKPPKDRKKKVGKPVKPTKVIKKKGKKKP